MQNDVECRVFYNNAMENYGKLHSAAHALTAFEPLWNILNSPLLSNFLAQVALDVGDEGRSAKSLPGPMRFNPIVKSRMPQVPWEYDS
jgi:hypothetical protein